MVSAGRDLSQSWSLQWLTTPRSFPPLYSGNLRCYSRSSNHRFAHSKTGGMRPPPGRRPRQLPSWRGTSFPEDPIASSSPTSRFTREVLLYTRNVIWRPAHDESCQRGVSSTKAIVAKVATTAMSKVFIQTRVRRFTLITSLSVQKSRFE